MKYNIFVKIYQLLVQKQDLCHVLKRVNKHTCVFQHGCLIPSSGVEHNNTLFIDVLYPSLATKYNQGGSNIVNVLLPV